MKIWMFSSEVFIVFTVHLTVPKIWEYHYHNVIGQQWTQVQHLTWCCSSANCNDIIIMTPWLHLLHCYVAFWIFPNDHLQVASYSSNCYFLSTWMKWAVISFSSFRHWGLMLIDIQNMQLQCSDNLIPTSYILVSASSQYTVKALIRCRYKIITICKGALFGAKKITRALRGTLFREAPSN